MVEVPKGIWGFVAVFVVTVAAILAAPMIKEKLEKFKR